MDEYINAPLTPPSGVPPRANNMKIYIILAILLLLGLAAGTYYYFKNTKKVPESNAVVYQDKDKLYHFTYDNSLQKTENGSSVAISNVMLNPSSLDAVSEDGYLIKVETASISNCSDNLDVKASVQNLYDIEEPASLLTIDGVNSQLFKNSNDSTKLITVVPLEENLLTITFETELSEQSNLYKEGEGNYYAVLDSMKIPEGSRKKQKIAQIPTKSYPVKHYTNSLFEFDYYGLPLENNITENVTTAGLGTVGLVTSINCDSVTTTISKTQNKDKVSIASLLEQRKKDLNQDVYPELGAARELEVNRKKFVLFYKPAFTDEDGGRIGTFELITVDNNYIYTILQGWTKDVNNQSIDRIDFGSLIANTIEFK